MSNGKKFNRQIGAISKEVHCKTRMHSSRMRTARSLTVFPGSLSSLGVCG